MNPYTMQSMAAVAGRDLRAQARQAGRARLARRIRRGGVRLPSAERQLPGI